MIDFLSIKNPSTAMPRTRLVQYGISLRLSWIPRRAALVAIIELARTERRIQKCRIALRADYFGSIQES